MNYIEQIQYAINYIEENLENDIQLEQVARAANISQWHFQRIFKALSNETLKMYIRSRRLATSLGKLLVPDNKIIDIALSSGYESQESFTRAFKKMFNMTPNQFRKIGDKNLFLQKLQFDSEYLRHINQNISLTPEIHPQNKMLLVGLKTKFYSVDSDKNNIGDKLPPLWGAFLDRMHEVENTVSGVCYGVIQQANPVTEQLDYYAAIEVARIDSIPEKMVSIEIPAARYARFTHKGEVNKIDNTVNYIYSSWLLQSGKYHTYGPDLEIYGPDYHPVSEQSIMHYAIPVK